MSTSHHAPLLTSSRKQGEEQTEQAESQSPAPDIRHPTSVLDDIPHAFPALLRAHKLQKRAAQVGFDWPDVQPVYDKIEEELEEVTSAIASNDPSHIEEEIGDLLFVVANLARHVNVNPEEALRRCNHKFEARFRYIEQAVHAKGKRMEDCTLTELDALWDEAKKSET